jgi:hypothetical protein
MLITKTNIATSAPLSLAQTKRRQKANFSKSQPKVAFFQPIGWNPKTSLFFAEDGDDSGDSAVEIKKALVAVEGEFKDSDGRPHSFSPDRLETIAEHTNRALEEGQIVPLCTDHEKKVSNTVGGVEGKAYTKVIQESDLPNPRAKHLVGKLGLFLDDVVVKAKDAVDKVRNGIVTSVSMGLNLDPKEHRIIELSLVPIPAIPNMGLFQYAGFGNTASFNFNSMDDNNVFTWEDLESNEQTLEDLKEEYDDLNEKLWKLLNNIYTSESIDITDVTMLKQYVYTALNGFSLRVVDLLGLTDVPDDMSQGADPNDPMATMTADQQMQQTQTQMQGVADPSMQDPSTQQPVSYKRNTKGLLNFAKQYKYSTLYI